MSDKDRKAISRSVIARYWKDKAITPDGDVVEDDPHREDLVSVIEYFSEPRCWVCGKEYDPSKHPKYEEKLQTDPSQLYNLAKVNLERCHIVAHALGGSDTDPANMFLLCGNCHKLSPDTPNPKNFLRWVYRERKRVYALGRDIASLVKMVEEECKLQGKDPFSGDPKAMNCMWQGSSIADSTLVFAYVDTCKPISKNSAK